MFKNIGTNNKSIQLPMFQEEITFSKHNHEVSIIQKIKIDEYNSVCGISYLKDIDSLSDYDKILSDRNKERQLDSMSFVGLIKCTDGVLGFADSKASRIYSDGTIAEDVERSPISKVFANSQCIFVTFGANELFSKNEYLECYIENNLKQKTFSAFIDELKQKYSEEKRPLLNKKITFLVSEKEHPYFIAIDFVICDNEILINKKNIQTPIIFGGDELMINIFEKFNRNEMTIKETTQLIKDIYPHLIAIGNLIRPYNFIGGPLQTKDFRFE